MSGLDGLDGAVELLDRSLSYTRVALASVRDDRLSVPTPCARWDLAGLLQHMEDSLDAFGEGAAGRVALTSAGAVPAGVRTASLQRKACALLGAWSRPPERVRIGPCFVDTALVAQAAALEIAVHGWDVARALTLDHPLPESLAGRLLPVAASLVTDQDRGGRFGPVRPAAPTTAPTPAAARLLRFLGRDLTGPPGQEIHDRSTGPQLAS